MRSASLRLEEAGQGIEEASLERAWSRLERVAEAIEELNHSGALKRDAGLAAAVERLRRDVGRLEGALELPGAFLGAWRAHSYGGYSAQGTPVALGG